MPELKIFVRTVNCRQSQEQDRKNKKRRKGKKKNIFLTIIDKTSNASYLRLDA
jgi:hypothetical protein